MEPNNKCCINGEKINLHSVLQFKYTQILILNET